MITFLCEDYYVVIRYLLLVILLASCSSKKTIYPDSGSFVIARPAPIIFTGGNSGSLLGFFGNPSVVIDRSQKEIVISGSESIRVKISGVENLSGSEAIVSLKQKDPVWYAPEEYFRKRGLLVPPDYSRDRFLKGVLGEYVLYLNDEIPLHSGRFELDEVGGVRALDLKTFSKVYYALNVGSKVSIK